MDLIELTANGKTYRLLPLGTNQLCALEERLGKNFGTIMAEIGALGIESMRLHTVRIFLIECLTEKVSEEEVSTVIDELGFDGISGAINGLIWPAREMKAA